MKRLSCTLAGWKRNKGFLGQCGRVGKAEVSGSVTQHERVLLSTPSIGKKLDRLFFGSAEDPETAWEKRAELLGKEEKHSMESLVQQKTQDNMERILAWDPNE